MSSGSGSRRKGDAGERGFRPCVRTGRPGLAVPWRLAASGHGAPDPPGKPRRVRCTVAAAGSARERDWPRVRADRPHGHPLCGGRRDRGVAAVHGRQHGRPRARPVCSPEHGPRPGRPHGAGRVRRHSASPAGRAGMVRSRSRRSSSAAREERTHERPPRPGAPGTAGGSGVSRPPVSWAPATPAACRRPPAAARPSGCPRVRWPCPAGSPVRCVRRRPAPRTRRP